MNVFIFLILLFIIFLNSLLFFKEGYTDGSINISKDIDNDGTNEYANVNQIGEFKDNRHRTMEKFYGRPTTIENAIEVCANKAYNDGYTFFGLQHPHGGGRPECFATNNYSSAISLGNKNNYVGSINKYKWVKRSVRKKRWKRCVKRKKGIRRRTWCRRWVRHIRRTRVQDGKIEINSDDFGTSWGNTVYEIDKSDIIYDEAKDIITKLQGNRNYVGDWELVFGKLEDNTVFEVEDWLSLLNENRTNSNSSVSITRDNVGNIHYGIIWRTCDNCIGQFRDIFYKRLTPWKQNNNEIKKLFNSEWKTENNVFNVDYQLYDSYSDALNQHNPWEYCPSQDSVYGFPGLCGPKSEVSNQSRSTETTENKNIDWTFLIENVDPPNAGFSNS
jgi:hypothetical protein